MRPWAARVIIVVLVLLLGAAIGALLAHFVRLSIFSGMDRLLGFAFGLLRGFLLLGVFVILGQLLRLSGESWWRQLAADPVRGIGRQWSALAGRRGARRPTRANPRSHLA